MNDLIRQMVQPLLDAFDMYEISSPALKSEVENFKSRLINFAEDQNDVMAYYTAFASSGLQEEYTDLISKAAVASVGAVTDESVQSNEEDSAVQQVTVKDFLEQYRPAYNEVCKRGSLRGRAAYEKVFQVADRTDDMLEAQIILEKERLLWKIVSEDALEIFEKKLQEMDPLFLSSTAVLLGQIKCYENSTCEEELEYMLARQEIKNLKIITDFNCRINLAALLAKNIIEYLRAKKTVYDWPGDTIAQNGMKAMLLRKSRIRFLVAYMKENMGITPNDLFEDPGISIWMLNARNADQYGKQKKIINQENLKRFREVLENEILKDISLKDALLKY